MSSLKLNTSYNHHLLVAFVISFWLVLFLVLIAPFDVAELSFSIRLQILPFYGVIFFVAYMILVPIQNWIFKKLGRWTLFLEILIIILFTCIGLMGSYLYYTTDIINGNYSFSKYTLEVYYPIFLILLPILLFSRWYLNKKAIHQISDKVILTGENKLDVLQIRLSDLVCISSADNYVEVSHIIKNELHKKLLRITLKNMHPQVPSLLQVHRSHLINPQHFKEWKNSNTLLLTQIEVPISKSY
ncbi:MAG: LytTR family transcriptional regulator DNA-binding domain-containing protein [Maribacter sp.]